VRHNAHALKTFRFHNEWCDKEEEWSFEIQHRVTTVDCITLSIGLANGNSKLLVDVVSPCVRLENDEF
jgi:hypothetical protein